MVRTRSTSLLRRLVLALAAVAVGLTGTLVTAAPAAASLPESHTFDGWQNGTLGDPDFLIAADSETRRDGPIALRIDYSSPQAGTGRYAHIFQDVLVRPGTTYNLSAWVRGENVSQTGAFYIPLTGDHSQRAELPGGTYDWQQLTWQYTIPANQSSFRVRVLARGPGTVWFDNMSMSAAGSSQNLLANPSFDLFQPPTGVLRFADETLIYETGDAEVAIDSQDSEVSWTLHADSGQIVGEGDAPVLDGRASIDLSDRGPGYYTLETRVDSPQATTRSASLAILEPRSSAYNSDHPFGLSMHARRHTVDAVNQMLSPMGNGMVRENPAWSDIEKMPGVYDFSGHFDDQIQAAIARGERPLVITPISNPLYDNNQTPASPQAIEAYANMARALAAHYGDAVDYEIYNEFNHTGNRGSCGRTPECYMQLLVPTAAAIRESVPDATIVGGGIAGLDLQWLDGLFDLGALDHIDVLSFHSYDIPRAPEGETETEIAALEALLASYGAPDLPIWMSEHGWHTQVGGVSEQLQGAYTVRSAILLHAAGVDRVLYYTMTDSGLNPAEKEHNFGFVRSNLGVNSALAPKPSYVAYSVFNRLTAGVDLQSVDQLGDARVATFSASGRADTRVVWAPSAETLEIEVSGSVQVVEASGREWSAGDGQDVQITVGEQPIYIIGSVDAVRVAETPFLTIDRPAQVALGDSPVLPVHIDGSALGVDGAVEISGVAGETATVVAGTQAASGTIELVPFTAAGLQPLRIAATTEVGLAALHVSEIDALENPALALVPSFDAASSEAVASLRISNLESAPPISVDDIAWQVGQETGTSAGATVGSGDETSIELGRDLAALWQPFAYHVNVTADGQSREATGTSVFAPVITHGSEPIVKAQWLTHGRWVSLGGATPSPEVDLGGSFHLEWDSEGLSVVADVIDDDHVAAGTAAQLWAGDSLQFAASPGLPGSSTSRVELGAALLDSGAAVHSFTPAGVVPTASAEIVHDEVAATTSYRVHLPWGVLGVHPDDGVFSFSLVLNDNDAGTRDGFVEWGSGIGGRKETADFLPLTLIPSPAEPPVLSSLSVDGVALEGFDPELLNYEIAALAGGPLPQIDATAPVGAEVEIIQATSAPGEATVIVTDGDLSQTYHITVGRTVGDDASVDATAEVVCSDGEERLVVTVKNDGQYESAVRAASVLGDERRDRLAPGDTAIFTFDEADGAGTVAVSAYVPYAAPDRAASYVWERLAYDAISCSGRQ